MSLVLASGQGRKYIKYRQKRDKGKSLLQGLMSVAQLRSIPVIQSHSPTLPIWGHTAPVTGAQICSATSSVVARMELQTCWVNKTSLAGEKQKRIQVHSYLNENEIDLF